MDYSKKYDVVVAGGGIAGVAAALAAAEMGARTAIVEKTVFFGGLATTGLIYAYLPICDGAGTQVSFGLAEKLLHASIKYGPGTIPKNWNARPWSKECGTYATIFSPASFVLAIDELLEAAGVDVWVDTLICGAELDGRQRLKNIIVENKSGRGNIAADCFVDASGDADVVRRAGGKIELGNNYLAVWVLQQQKNITGADFEALLKMRYCCEGAADRQGSTGHEISRFVMESRALLRKYYAQEYTAGNGDRASLYPVILPAMPQYRKIARIIGQGTLIDNQHATCFEDSIGMAGDWRKSGYTWEMPYSTLLPETVKGILAAGRCTSAAGDAWEITRVIPTAAVTGEAAGVAAALAVREKTTPDLLAVKEVQSALRARGIKLHLPEVGLKYK